MIGRIAEPSGREPLGREPLEPQSPMRRSGVGLASSLMLHALFFAVVWVFTGLSFIDELPEEPVRIVRLVPGDRETSIARPSRPQAGRRAAAAKPAAKPAASRPIATPEPLPVPDTVTGPVPESVVPEPAAVPETVVASEPAALELPPAIAQATATGPVSSPQDPPGPAVEPPATPAPAAKEVTGTDVAVQPRPEDARAVVSEASTPRPELAWLQAVTSDPTVAARAHGEPFLGRREVFEFLLDNLEFASHVTRALRLGRYRAWQTAEGLVLDDGWGSLLNLSVVEATNGARVLYARGHYRQSVLPNIHGQAVLKIEWDTRPADGGRDMVTAAVTTYVKVESGFMAFLMKLASATVTDKAETESRRVVRTFARVSRAIEEDPAKVFDQVRRSPDVPQAALEQFRRLLKVP
jgi:hypothetical protein